MPAQGLVQVVEVMSFDTMEMAVGNPAGHIVE